MTQADIAFPDVTVAEYLTFAEAMASADIPCSSSSPPQEGEQAALPKAGAGRRRLMLPRWRARAKDIARSKAVRLLSKARSWRDRARSVARARPLPRRRHPARLPAARVCHGQRRMPRPAATLRCRPAIGQAASWRKPRHASASWRSIHAPWARPVARTPAPAPADHGRLPSPARALPSSRQPSSSASTGTDRGDSRSSAACPARAKPTTSADTAV